MSSSSPVCLSSPGCLTGTCRLELCVASSRESSNRCHKSSINLLDNHAQPAASAASCALSLSRSFCSCLACRNTCRQVSHCMLTKQSGLKRLLPHITKFSPLCHHRLAAASSQGPQAILQTGGAVASCSLAAAEVPVLCLLPVLTQHLGDHCQMPRPGDQALQVLTCGPPALQVLSQQQQDLHPAPCCCCLTAGERCQRLLWHAQPPDEHCALEE